MYIERDKILVYLQAHSVFSASAFKTGTQVPIVNTCFIPLSSLVHFALVCFTLDIDFTMDIFKSLIWVIRVNL